MANIFINLSEAPLDYGELISFVKTPEAGAIVYFGGTTRDNFQGKQVKHLSYEAYEPLAVKTLSEIAERAVQKWNASDDKPEQIFKVAIVHRLGLVPVMQESVIIAVSSAHRHEGFQAAEWILEEVKKRAEIWKNETYEDGSSSWKANPQINQPDQANNPS